MLAVADRFQYLYLSWGFMALSAAVVGFLFDTLPCYIIYLLFFRTSRCMRFLDTSLKGLVMHLVAGLIKFHVHKCIKNGTINWYDDETQRGKTLRGGIDTEGGVGFFFGVGVSTV